MNIEIKNNNLTVIDRDNNRVIDNDYIAKLDISDKCSYTDIVFTLLIKDANINQSCKDLLKYMINCGKSEYVTKDLIAAMSKYTKKSERTFVRCISELKQCRLIRENGSLVYIPNNVFNAIKHSTKLLVIEINPEPNKINL